MTADHLVKLLRRRPFQPRRLHLADGRKREIHHPRMAIVSRDMVAIGVPYPDDARIALSITTCSLANVVAVESI
jgi:hypothetical protein